MYLRRHMMRFAAGPFDWLAGGSFQTRTEAILSEFKDFLNREDLELRELAYYLAILSKGSVGAAK